MSRMERSSRSVSQPRGKRDSSVSSAYAGGTRRGDAIFLFFINISLKIAPLSIFTYTYGVHSQFFSHLWSLVLVTKWGTHGVLNLYQNSDFPGFSGLHLDFMILIPLLQI